VAISTGRIFRFPFDDEIYTLKSVDLSQSISKVFLKYAYGADIHPPMSYVLFSLLNHLGFSERGMHVVSLAMTMVSLGLLQLIALNLVSRRAARPASAATRLAAILLFGLNALAVSQGDALRWYPLLSLLVSLFLACYILGQRPGVRVAAAIPL